MTIRDDGWINALTAMGDTSRDKRLASSFDYATRLSQAELEELWRGDAMAARIVSLLPDEEFRAGFDLALDDGLDGGDVLEALEDLQATEKLHEARTWGRLYGGAVVVLGVEDGRLPHQPLDLERARALRFLNVLTRWEIQPIAYYEDPFRDARYGEPKLYRVNNATPGQPVNLEIHESRLIRFGGVTLPRRLRAENQGWDDPVLQRVYDGLRGYAHGHVGVEQILQDFTVTVLMLEGLKELLSNGDEAAIKSRIKGLMAAKSMLNAIILDANDKHATQTTSVAGLADLVSAVERRLVAATGYPHTILLGESPGASLGEGGGSQKRDFYDQVKASQVRNVQPAWVRLLSVFLATKDGPTGGTVPDRWPIVWRPLWQPSEEEKAKAHGAQAAADSKYLADKVISRREIRESRFGGQGWSSETTLIPGEGERLEAEAEEAAAAAAAALAGAPEPDADEEDNVDPRGDADPKKKRTARYPSW